MAVHSNLFPPSGGWTLCPSWEHDPAPSAAADEGTKRHAILEAWLRHRLEHGETGRAWTWQPEVMVDGQPAQVTSDDVKAVNQIIPYLNNHPAVVNHGKFGYHVWVEQRVDFGSAIGRPNEDFIGTSDVILMTPNLLEILDFKFGRGIVIPPTPQFQLYALGAGGLVYSPEFAAQSQQLQKIKLTVAQPTNPQGPIHSWEGSIDTLIEWSKWAKAKVEAREKYNGFTYTPSEDACRWCRKANTCQARLSAAADMLETVASPTPWKPLAENLTQTAIKEVMGGEKEDTRVNAKPTPLAPSEKIQSLAETYVDTDVGEISDEDLGRFLDVWGQLRAFGKDMEEESKRRLMAGRQVPGWKMVSGKRSRRVKEKYKEDFEDLLLKLSGVRKKDVYEHKLKTLAQIEGVVNANCGQIVQRRFAELWEMADGAPVLATADDPRPGVNPTPEYLEDVSEPVNPNNAITNEQAERGEPIENETWF